MQGLNAAARSKVPLFFCRNRRAGRGCGIVLKHPLWARDDDGWAIAFVLKHDLDTAPVLTTYCHLKKLCTIVHTYPIL